MNRILWNKRERPDQDIDEIVLENATVHIEQMGDNCWWIGITRAPSCWPPWRREGVAA